PAITSSAQFVTQSRSNSLPSLSARPPDSLAMAMQPSTGLFVPSVAKNRPQPQACSPPSHEAAHRSHALTGRRGLRRLDRVWRQSLLLLEVSKKGLEVEVVALHLLSTLPIQLVNNGISAHWGSPNNSSGVQIYGSAQPKLSQIKATRGRISAFAMWAQFHVSR